jgi:hypothetical protein
MDNGSGGFMTDLTFNGGKYGAFFGNQQFTTRNLIFNNCQTAIFMVRITLSSSRDKAFQSYRVAVLCMPWIIADLLIELELGVDSPGNYH